MRTHHNPSRGAALRAVRLLAVALALLALAPAARAADAFVVVVNASNPVSSMSRSDVSRRFLKQATTWPNGNRVEPVDQHKSSPVRQAFTREVLGRSVASVTSFWVQAIYSGREVPPPEKGNDGDVLAFVRAIPNAIGYVSADTPLDGVKKVSLHD